MGWKLKEIAFCDVTRAVWYVLIRAEFSIAVQKKKKKKASPSFFPPLVPVPSLTFQLSQHFSRPVCWTYFSKPSVSSDPSRWVKRRTRRGDTEEEATLQYSNTTLSKKKKNSDKGINKWVTSPQSSIRLLNIAQKALTCGTFIVPSIHPSVKSPLMPNSDGERFFSYSTAWLFLPFLMLHLHVYWICMFPNLDIN